jgi:peptidylprolyl isomerase
MPLERYPQSTNEKIAYPNVTVRNIQSMSSPRNITAACVALFLVGCGNADQGSAVDALPEATTVEITQATTSTTVGDEQIWAETSVGDDRPSISVASDKQGPKGLVIEDITIGTGEQALAGDLLEVKYVGALLADGTEFDASWNRNQTFFVPIGVGAVIPGWDQGIVGMRKGGRRLLVIPPELAYGNSGAGAAIPPNATLVFVVDLIEVVDLPIPQIPDVTEIGSSLEIEDLSEGTGAVVQPGDTVSVHYLGTLLDGSVFDTSWNRGRPFTTQIGVGMVIQGWDQGVVGMREGGRRLLKIPSDLAYGEAGSGTSIGPNTPLVFVVDLLRIQG